MKERETRKLSTSPDQWTLPGVADALGFPSIPALSTALATIDKSGYSQYVIVAERKRRVISEPRLWLKALQRRAYAALLQPLPIPDFVFGRRGAGVVEHARSHIAHDYVTILDVTKCFPSTTVSMVRGAFRTASASREVADTLTRLTTLHGFLPQGAPTSPAVLNLVFSPIDMELQALAARFNATFTRYMDDLAFSGDAPLDGLASHASRILRKFGFNCNPAKRREWGPGALHTITNIVVSTTLNPTPEFLRSLSRHLEKFGTKECALTEEQLRGKVEWVKRLNRDLGTSLERELRHHAAATATF